MRDNLRRGWQRDRPRWSEPAQPQPAGAMAAQLPPGLPLPQPVAMPTPNQQAMQQQLQQL